MSTGKSTNSMALDPVTPGSDRDPFSLGLANARKSTNSMALDPVTPPGSDRDARSLARANARKSPTSTASGAVTPGADQDVHSLALASAREQLALESESVNRRRRALANQGFDIDRRVIPWNPTDSMKEEATCCNAKCKGFATELLGLIRAELAAMQTAIIDDITLKLQMRALTESNATQTISEAPSSSDALSSDVRIQVTTCNKPGDDSSVVGGTLEKMRVVESQRTFEASMKEFEASTADESAVPPVPNELEVNPIKTLAKMPTYFGSISLEELEDPPYPFYWYTRGFTGYCGWNKIESIIVRWYSLQMPPRTGSLFRFQESVKFELIFAVVIFINFAFQIVRVNNSIDGLPEKWYIHALDVAFGAIFGLECAIKIAATGWYFFVRDGMFWNWLDFILVLMSVIDVFMHTSHTSETNLVRVFRFVRLVKMVRVVRVMMLFKTLRKMLDSLFFSVASLFWSLLMLFAICAMFGLVFTQLTATRILDDSLDDIGMATLLSSFGSVQQASLTLFKSTTGGADWGETYDALAYIGLLSQCLYFFYVCFTQVAVLNIVTGVFVDSAMNAGELTFDERVAQLQEEHCQAFKGLLHLVRHHMVSDDSDSLSLEDLEVSLQNEEVRGFLATHGISIFDPSLLFSVLSRHDETQRITAFDFVSGCLGLRGFTSGNDNQILSFQGSLCHAKMFQLQSHVTTELDNLTKLLLQETSRIGGVSKM